jgi:hypothetical protein
MPRPIRSERDGFVPIPESTDDDECDQCADEAEFDDPENEVCPNSQRPCQHHCNHQYSHDHCHWCGAEWGEDGVRTDAKRP